MNSDLLEEYSLKSNTTVPDEGVEMPLDFSRKWILLNKHLNKGMDSHDYVAVFEEACTLLDDAIAGILAANYLPGNLHENIDRLSDKGYAIGTYEKLNLLEALTIRQITYDSLKYCLNSIGDILHRLRMIEKDKINPGPFQIRAEVGEVIEGKCTLLSIIGLGAGGRVFEGTYEGVPGKVAVKEISPHLIPFFNYEKERQFLMAIEHRGIPKVYDVLRNNQTYYIVMEFVSGTTITAFIEEHGRLPLLIVKELSMQMADILCYLYRSSSVIIHCDLNPDNIMVDEENNLHIIDFGIDYNARAKHPKIRMFSGDSSYISPESLDGEENDIRSDIYALGGIIYYLFEGRSPIPGNSQTFRKDTDSAISTIIEKAMAQNKKWRYQKLSQLMEDFLSVRNLGSVPEVLYPGSVSADREAASEDKVREEYTASPIQYEAYHKQLVNCEEQNNTLRKKGNKRIVLFIGLLLLLARNLQKNVFSRIGKKRPLS